MKVALINSLYKPYKRGGAEVVFSNIVKELKKDGHDVFVITISGKKNKTNFFVTFLDNVKVYRFYPKNIFSFIEINDQPLARRLLWLLIDTLNVHSYRQVRKILKIEKPDLVLSHNIKGLGYLTLMAIRSLKIKNIHTLHDIQLVNPSGLMIFGQKNYSFLYKIYALLTRSLIGSPTVVASPSKWLLDYYQPYGFFRYSQEVVLPNPIILDEGNYQKNFIDDKINFLFIGQLETHKGIEFLLKVFSEFAPKNNCRLLVVGSGRLEQDLRDKYSSEKWVEFLGFIPANKLGQLVYKKIHFTIVPSLCYENSPSVIIDSFKYATPVIASAIGGIPELVQEGVNGFLFEPGNKISLINKLNASMQSLEKFHNMSENAKIKARDFDMKGYVYKLLNL